MSTFATVAEALSSWPQPSHAQAEGTAARLLAAIRQLQSSPESVGPWDLAGLIGQVLREEMLRAPGQDWILRVPVAAKWPDRFAWEQHGIDVTLRVHDWMHLRARSWQPAWLPGASAVSPIDAALRRDVRRIDAHVASDPVWTELLGQHEYLSPGQRDAVRASVLLEPGRSLLVVLPTGGGKSLVAHAPALLEADEGATTLLVVPTVALALDQERRVAQLVGQQRGGAALRSFAYHGGLAPEEKCSLRERIAEGHQPLVIASPEAVVQALKQPLLRCARRGGLRAIVVDEAHLVSQWGNEFRPEFQALAGVRRLLVQASPEGAAPCTILLTATLTQDGWRTLRSLFGTPDLGLIAAMHLRPEPDYFVSDAAETATRDARVLEVLRFAPRPLILYTALREEVDRWYDRLRASGLRRIGKIHGAMPAQERARQLLAWSSAEIDVMVATSAFGLGMDNADVRTVVHACVPETLDRYYQEVGRGGRDGRACVSFLIYEPGDTQIARMLNNERIVGVEKGLLRWQSMYHGSMQSDGDERLLVSLDSRATHVQADSDANVAWNMRTLVLMARAGLVELDAAEPPSLEPETGESAEAFEQRQRRAYERYALSIAVRPTGLDHLDPATWNQRVQQARRETLRADRRSLEQVERLITGSERFADLLVEAYSLDAEGGRVEPQPVDGHCPVSRAVGLTPGSYLVPEPLLAIDVPTSVGLRVAGLLPPDTRFLVVAVPSCGSRSVKRWREALLPVMRMLVGQGVREIRVPRGWLDLVDYRALYRYARPRIVFHTELRGAAPNLVDELLVPRLTVIERGGGTLDLLAEIATSRRPMELLFVPEDLPDPRRPDRSLISVREHIPLSHLRMELD